MASRINIGPEDGPYVAINESSGNLQLEDNSGNVVAEWDETNAQWDFANNTLNNVDALDSNSVSTESIENGIAGDGNTITSIADNEGEYRLLTSAMLADDHQTDSTSFERMPEADRIPIDLIGVNTNIESNIYASVAFRFSSGDEVTVRVVDSPQTEITADEDGENYSGPIGLWEDGSTSSEGFPLRAEVKSENGEVDLESPSVILWEKIA